jgi:hypothetical protein
MPTLEQLKARDAKAKAKAAKKVPLEKDVEGPVKDYARSHKCWVRKFKSENNRSVPDDIFSTPKGKVFFIEFKRPGKTATEAQQDEHDMMRERGLTVFVVDNVELGKRVVDDMLAAD